MTLRPRSGAQPKRHGLARILSKRGVASRSQAAQWILAGRVGLAGRVIRDPEFPVAEDDDRLELDGLPLPRVVRCYLALNKPRGLVTTAADEKGRDTVYRCLEGTGLPWVGPVGRLDKASEGLLLMSNDPGWAAAITDPESGPDKTYHVQTAGIADPATLARLQEGIDCAGERLACASARTLRSGERNGWIEVVLNEGRNRQIRRLLGAVDLPVLRLVRVAIGPVELGELGKGQWRHLSPEEVLALSGGPDRPGSRGLSAGPRVPGRYA